MSEDRTQHLPNDDLRQILAQLTQINSRLDRVDARLDSIDARFDRMDARLDSMDARLEKIEARDYDTKPIWENALKEIADTRAEMREGFAQVNARVDKLQAEVRESRAEATAEMRKAVRQIDVLNHNLLEIQAELRSLDDRLLKLEPQSA